MLCNCGSTHSPALDNTGQFYYLSNKTGENHQDQLTPEAREILIANLKIGNGQDKPFAFYLGIK